MSRLVAGLIILAVALVIAGIGHLSGNRTATLIGIVGAAGGSILASSSFLGNMVMP